MIVKTNLLIILTSNPIMSPFYFKPNILQRKYFLVNLTVRSLNLDYQLFYVNELMMINVCQKKLVVVNFLNQT